MQLKYRGHVACLGCCYSANTNTMAQLLAILTALEAEHPRAMSLQGVILRPLPLTYRQLHCTVCLLCVYTPRER